MASLLARRKQGGGMKIDTASSRPAVAVTKRITHLGKESFTSRFKVEGDIHDGGEQCRIKVVKDRQNGSEYAVKVQAKRRIRGANEALFRRMTERMMNMPADANVVNVHACFEDDQYFYTMMDSCKGGDLFDFFRMLVSDDMSPDELNRELQIVMKEMMRSLNHLHVQGMIHKDVKLENLVFMQQGGVNMTRGSAKSGADDGSPKSPKMLKLIDFDFTEEWEPGSPRSKAVVGTDGYIAPEAYHGDVNPKSDIYSAGVVLYLLVVGRFPYPDEIFDDQPGENYVGNAKMKEIYIKMEKYWNANGSPATNKDPKMFASRAWGKLREAREFVMKCMEFDFMKRYDAAQALQDPWLKDVKTMVDAMKK